MTGEAVYLPWEPVVREYCRRRDQSLLLDEGARPRAVNQALFEMWTLYTAPFRVLRVEPKAETNPRYHVLRVEGHGMEVDIWQLRGDHRELDALRMSVMLRNEWYEAQQQALEVGELAFELRHVLENVRQLTASGEGSPGI